MEGKFAKWIRVQISSGANFLVFVIVFIFVLSIARSISKINEINTEIAKSQAEVEALKQKEDDLKAQLNEVRSDDFIERQLRDKLNFSKEGEIVVVLPPDEVLLKYAPSDDIGEATLPDPNWKKWAKLFGFI